MNTYAYDSANRLSTLNGAATVVSYTYNGMGDRLQEIANGSTTTFTMDLNTGLTQALSDGTYTYTYGLGRIAQYDTTAEYFLGDALGSVRQLTDDQGRITLAKAYNPYGVVSMSAGAGQSSYGYTSEYPDGYIELVYLRARHYAPAMGRFLSRDTWSGDVNRPGSLNRWNYVEANPIIFADPSGNTTIRPNGYAEGIYSTFLLGLLYWEVYGTEVVYDFETYERAAFTFTGAVEIDKDSLEATGFCINWAAYSVGAYVSAIELFDSREAKGDLLREYEGYSVSMSLSSEFNIGSVVGMSMGAFSSAYEGRIPNFQLVGVSIGIYGGIGNSWEAVPFSIGGYWAKYTYLQGSHKQYTNIYDMIADIKRGDGSPINGVKVLVPEPFNSLTNGIINIGMDDIRDFLLENSNLCDFENKTCINYKEYGGNDD